jgi:mediator of RNA polymerase II transcription subunit 5
MPARNEPSSMAPAVAMDRPDRDSNKRPGAGALAQAILFWETFIDRCVRERLDTDRFQSFARQVQQKHRLPGPVIADICLRPAPNNSASLDPRIPQYLQILGALGYVDMASILKALYKYSSSHTLVESQQGLGETTHETNSGGDDADNKNNRSNNGIKGGEDDQKQVRWKNSYWAEDHIFYALTRWVVEGRAAGDSKAALELVRILSKWVALFTAASAAFATDLLGQVQTAQVEMESSRAGLVAVLICLRDSPVLLQAISKPMAKGECGDKTNCHILWPGSY